MRSARYCWMVFLLLAGCHGSGLSRAELREFRARQDAFTALCNHSAHESIKRFPADVKTVYLSKPSAVTGLYSFELFFGLTRARRWAGATLLDGPAPGNIRDDDAFEVRYTHLPVTKTVDGTAVIYNGVRQEIIALRTGEVIAERENYIAGKDFNRSVICLGSGWFSGNDEFVDRVLGYRYRDESKRSFVPETYIKAKVAGVTPVKVHFAHDTGAAALPAGSQEIYNDRKIVLPNGSSFPMPQFRNQEPLPIVATLEEGADYVFVHLPGGPARNWPVRQVMLFRRDKSGQAISKLYIQLPVSLDWTKGWAIPRQSITLDQHTLRLSIYGGRTDSGAYPQCASCGDYSMRVDYVAQLAQ